MNEWQKKQDEEEKYIAEELREYQKNKQQLKSSIAAANYKLDDEYLTKVENSANEIEASVRMGLKHQNFK
jgi:hypothetical protein